MSGTARSGNRHHALKLRRQKLAVGVPQRPRKLSAQEKWCWDHVITPAAHLATLDTSLAWVACELWSLYRAAVAEAKANPCDKDARIAVTNYAGQYRDVLAKLCIDPLGRERVAGKQKEEKVDPLREFGIAAG